MSKFKHGDRVSLIHPDNPFKGEDGVFVQYKEPHYSSGRGELIVILDSDKREHFFFDNEVIPARAGLKGGRRDES